MDRPILRQLDERVSRLHYGAMGVDFVRTSEGLLRLGSMPDLSKLASRLGVRDDAVVVPEWEVSQAGDNYTGEEFVQWRAQACGSHRKDYIGKPENVQTVYENLDRTFSYFFDRKLISIVKKRWLRKWVNPRPVDVVYESGSLRIQFGRNNIMIFDEGHLIYDRQEFRSRIDADSVVEEVLSQVRRDRHRRDELEVTVVGSGNGFHETSASFITRFGSKMLWIDPCAQPAHTLAKIGVHWDDVTDFLITHNHEDHILGFSACLKRKMDQGERLRLVTARSIYDVLRRQYLPLFPEMDQWIDWIEVLPGNILELNGIEMVTRWNHHFLPYGALGLKITAGGKTWGLSGDTKFDRRINAVLRREELTASWFRDCKLIFHEVDFVNPRGVHTYWKELEHIRNSVRGDVFAYHTASVENPPIPIACEGKTYRMD